MGVSQRESEGESDLLKELHRVDNRAVDGAAAAIRVHRFGVGDSAMAGGERYSLCVSVTLSVAVAGSLFVSVTLSAALCVSLSVSLCVSISGGNQQLSSDGHLS